MIKFDGKLDLAIGKSRSQKTWQNKSLLWSDIIKRLSKTHRSHESYAEYCAMEKARQDEIKDVGGFIGGYLAQGKRKVSNVLYRQCVTLDIDFGSPEFWEAFEWRYSCAAALYTTHKHSKEAPRYRLLIPLSRQVKADEYAAIARRIAGDLNIELFDATTFQPSRLMYWPSTAKDGDYEFKYQDGKWLNAGAVLKRYVDWRDSSEWPISEKAEKAITREIKKQIDPVEKHGIVGAFCRSYSITDVINDHLKDVYEATALPERYTFLAGSTSGGLVVYEDKFAFSHHGTDPVSGKLCNAFDLVRLHKFGLLDEDVEEHKGNRLTSYKAMIELAVKDKQVRKLIGRERLQEAKEDFSGLLEPAGKARKPKRRAGAKEGQEEAENEPGGDEDDWLAEMEVDSKGRYLTTINNIILVLNNDPELRGALAYDQFEEMAIARKSLPWRRVRKSTAEWTDDDDAGLRHYLEHNYKLVGNHKVKDAVDIVFYKNRFHPVRNYLEGLKWDGQERIDKLFVNYMGAADDEYTRQVARKFMCAGVARIFKPGCKFDYMVILVGLEGIKKSTLPDKLAQQWFSDSFMGVSGSRAFEQLHGVWIMEVPELNGMRIAEVDAVKHYVSKRQDAYRPAYGKRKVNRPRQTIFMGSTNRKQPLKDANGNRKFWPVVCLVNKQKFDIGKIKRETIDQLWAEAVEVYTAGETLYLDKELETVAKQIQEEHREKDARGPIVAEYLEKLLPENWANMNLYQRRAFLKEGDDEFGEGVIKRDRVTIHEIWTEALEAQIKDMSQHNTKPIHDIMRSITGWEMPKHGKFYNDGKPVRGYVRIAANSV